MGRLIGICLALLLALSPAIASAQERPPDVRISAVLSTSDLARDWVRALKQQTKLEVVLTTGSMNADVIDDLAQHRADIAIISRPLTLEDRSQYSDLTLYPVPLGMQAIAIATSDDLWDAGVRSITREAMRDIYEGKTTNWQDLPHGPNENVILYNTMPLVTFERTVPRGQEMASSGQGIWETFAEWLYGDARKAPLPKTEQLANSGNVADALEFASGAIAPVAAAYADGYRCHALGIQVDSRVIYPSAKTVADQSYPIARPIIAVVLDQPNLNNRVVTDFLTGPKGQAILRKNGDYGREAVPTPTPSGDY